MKGKGIIVHASLSLSILLVFGLGCVGATGKGDVVLAEFNWKGEKVKVTLGELEKEISELPRYKREKYSSYEGKKEYLLLMAESRLVLRAALDKGYEKDPELLDKVDDYLRDLVIEKLEDEEVKSKVKITEDEMRKYYEEHKDEFVEPEKVRLTCITIQAEEGKEEEAKKKAEEIFKRIKAGEDIKKIAKELSDKGENVGPGGRSGGDTGFFTRDTYPMAPEFTKAAFSLQPGQMYEGVLEQDIRGTKYYMIFRCEERKPQRQKKFEEEDVQRKIRRRLKRQKEDELMKALVDRLRRKAKVKVYADRIPDDPENFKGSAVELVLAEYEWDGQKHRITLADVQESIEKLPRFKRDRYKGKEGIEKRLNEVIEEELKLREGESRRYDLDPEIVDKVVEYMNQLLVQKIVEEEIDKKVTVTEDEMRRYYEEHKAEFVEPEKIRLTCITIQAEKGKEEEARKRAEEIYKRIKAGEDIKKIAKELSEKGENMGPGGRSGGDTGFFSRDSFPMAPEFTEAAFSLQPGQMYEGVLEQDIRGTKYYMIFRCEERKPQRQKKFEEEDVQREVRREVERMKRRQMLEEWLNKLKKEADFKIYYDRLPKPEEGGEKG